MSAMGAVPKTFKPQVAASSAVVGQLTFSVILWMALWVTISVSIIIVNKHVLYYTNFHYPLVLAVWHMVLATATSHFMIRTGGWQDTIRDHGSQRLYLQLGMIGLLFGGALAAGNAALLYISIPTVQMLKVRPASVTYNSALFRAMQAGATQLLSHIIKTSRSIAHFLAVAQKGSHHMRSCVEH